LNIAKKHSYDDCNLVSTADIVALSWEHSQFDDILLMEYCELEAVQLPVC